MRSPLAWLGARGVQADETPDTGAAASASAVDQPSATTGRRDRALDGGDRVVLASLAEKTLHGWLQNRHQTLYPLTINLRQLGPEQGAVLAGWAAVTLLAMPADQAGSDQSRQATTRAWLVSAGASGETTGAFDRALANPPPLNQAAARVIEHGVAPHAYVASLIALDPSHPVTAPFLDYAAARFALPSTVVRTATRRYRR